jgi:putative ABC transport system ATP-binding protein
LFPSHVIDDILKPLNLNLENQLDLPLSQLSGGQRQIIAFVMAILTRPKLLLLDEPTAALDPVSAQKLLSFAKAYVQMHQIPTLLITHDKSVAIEFGMKHFEMSRGTLVAVRKEPT